MTDVTDAIEESAQGPKSVSIDGQTVQQHSLPEQIAADEYVNSRRLRSRTTLPIFKTNTIPDGTV